MIACQCYACWSTGRMFSLLFFQFFQVLYSMSVSNKHSLYLLGVSFGIWQRIVFHE